MTSSISRVLAWTVAVALAIVLLAWAVPGIWQRPAAAQPIPRQVR